MRKTHITNYFHEIQSKHIFGDRYPAFFLMSIFVCQSYMHFLQLLITGFSKVDSIKFVRAGYSQIFTYNIIHSQPKSRQVRAVKHAHTYINPERRQIDNNFTFL